MGKTTTSEESGNRLEGTFLLPLPVVPALRDLLRDPVCIWILTGFEDLLSKPPWQQIRAILDQPRYEVVQQTKGDDDIRTYDTQVLQSSRRRSCRQSCRLRRSSRGFRRRRNPRRTTPDLRRPRHRIPNLRRNLHTL